MPYVVTCPACATRLKTPAVVPAGKAVTCPQCRHGFTTTEVSPELADSVAPRPPVPPPVPRRSREDDLPAAEFVDDDEEDDRLRTRKRRDDDDDPPARRKKAKKKKSPLVLILAIGLPLIFLLLVGAGIGGYFLFFRGGASSDMLAWAPSDAEMLEGVNISKISASPKLKRPFQNRLSRVEDLGVPLSDMDEVLFANALSGEVIVVRTKTKLDADALKRSSKAAEQTVNGKTYYRSPGGGCHHLPAARLLVFCASDTTMNTLLKKDAKVTINDELRGFVGKASGDVWHANTARNPLGIGMFGGFMAPKGGYGGQQVNGNQLKLTRTFVFADAASAQAAENQLRVAEQMFKAGRGRGQGLESVTVSSSGTTVTLIATGLIDDIGPGNLWGRF